MVAHVGVGSSSGDGHRGAQPNAVIVSIGVMFGGPVSILFERLRGVRDLVVYVFEAAIERGERKRFRLALLRREFLAPRGVQCGIHDKEWSVIRGRKRRELLL